MMEAPFYILIADPALCIAKTEQVDRTLPFSSYSNQKPMGPLFGKRTTSATFSMLLDAGTTTAGTALLFSSPGRRL
jgi:hypothetical protein